MDAQFFDTVADLRSWFEKNHDTASEIFVGYWKKGTGRTGVSHPEAIEQALCFGWIDSVGRRIDDQRHQVRFTPRRRGSVWSAINVAKVAELTERGLMHPAGLLAFDERKSDRVAVYSYEQPVPAELDAEQAARLQADSRDWVVSAKRAETRDRRLAQLISDSAAGRKVPPLAPR